MILPITIVHALRNDDSMLGELLTARERLVSAVNNADSPFSAARENSCRQSRCAGISQLGRNICVVYEQKAERRAVGAYRD